MAARTDITVNELPYQGGAIEVATAGDATNGMQFDNDGNTILKVENGGGVGITLTVASTEDQFGRPEDISQPLAAGEVYHAGPFLKAIWNQAGSKMLVDLDTDTSVTVTAIKYSPLK